MIYQLITNNKRFLTMYSNTRTERIPRTKKVQFIFARLYEVVKFSMCPKVTPRAMYQPMNASSNNHLLLCTATRASILSTYPPCFVPSPSSLEHSVKYVFSHDSGSLSLQFFFARIPHCSAYPRKSVSTLLPSQRIVLLPHLPSASRDRSSTAEPVRAAAGYRLLHPLKKNADGCNVFPSP